MKFRSMRFRMTFLLVFLLAPFLVISSHILLLSSQHADAEKARLLITKMLDFSAEALKSPDWKPLVEKAFANLELRERHIGALVADDAGQVLWQTPNDVPTWPRPGPDPLMVKGGGRALYVNAKDLVLHSDTAGPHLFALSALAVLAFGVASWLLVGRTLSPIRALARQASSASATDLGARLVAPSQDTEMRELVQTLNGFLGRMQEASEEKSRFYAAASHELRTPLQALSGHLEVALAQARTPEEYSSTLQEAYTQTQRLVSLVEAVLLLHHLQDCSPLEKESVCVGGLVEEGIDRLRPLIEARDLTVSVRIESSVTVESAPMHLNVLVRNLLENAARHGRSGGTFQVELTQMGGLRISNDAPEEAPSDVAQLFEPFYRLDASRSSKTGGNGLGLAICRQVAKLNGWDLSLRREGDLISAEVHFARPFPNEGDA